MPTRKITRVAPRTGRTDSPTQPRASESASLVDFLNALQQYNVTLLPISPQKGLEILGRGLSGLIQQSTADLHTILAFKDGVPSKKIHDTEHDQDWYSLVTEITILQHEPIKANLHIVDLLGVSFTATSSGAMGLRAWPFVVTSKVNRGDLTTILRENSGFLTEEVRMILFAGITEAIFVLHSCGITHGDLKTDNVLVQASEDDEVNPILIDFGSSAISGQTRLPTKSEPWNAPEIEVTTTNLDHTELVQLDLYSFGLLCLHLLLPLECLVSANLCLIRTKEQTDDDWARLVSQMRQKKAFRDGEDFCMQIYNMVECVDMSLERKRLVKKIVETTIQPLQGKRTLPWDQFLPHIGRYLSKRQLGLALGELDDMDYILPISILQDLLYKADHSACELCRLEYAFQASVCNIIGFGSRKDAISSESWLSRSRRTREDLDRAVQELGRQYQHPGRVSMDVLDALGIGVLVSTDKTQEYQTSRRLVDAEEVLKGRIQARASTFGAFHLSLGKSESELSKVLQAQSRLAEAEEHQIRAIKILRNHFEERHPSVLMANVNLASLMAKQGLLRKAECLALDTQPMLEAVLGPEHPETVTALQMLAVVQFELGKTKVAEQSMRQVIALRTKALTSIHPFTVRAELTLTSALRAQGRLTESSELMKSISLKLAGALAGDYLSKAELFIVWAMLYSTMGSFDQALQKVTEGLAAIDILRLPANDTLRLDGLEILASIYGNANKRGKQEAILRQILELRGGQEERNRETSATKCLLARSLLAQNRLDDACALADEVLVASDRSVAQDPENYVMAIDVMANAMAYRGQVDAAEKMQRDLVDVCISELGENNRFTLSATYSLGILLADRGNYQKGQHLYEKALASLETEAQHGVAVIKVKRLLAVVLSNQGRFGDAKTVCLQGIAWAINTVGERHVETLAVYNCLGRIYILTEKYAEADELYSSKLQEQSVGTAVEIYVLEHMALLRRRQQRIREAMELKRRSETLMKLALGDSHPEFVKMQGNVLGDYMTEPELFTDDIEKDVLMNIDRKKVILGPRHPSTTRTMCDLAYVYAMKGSLAKADTLFQELWETDAVSGVKNPEEYAKVLGKRADVCFRLGRLDQAETLEREALAVRRGIFGQDHVAIITNMANLASTLSAQGKHGEAEQYLRQVVAGRERTLQANLPSIFSFLKSRAALGAVLYYQGKYDESAGLYAASIKLAEQVGLPQKLVDGWQEELSEVVKKMSEGNEMAAADIAAV
ncbi:MAG: hypothetical protein Q9201_003460 [Fulgogasparrea decipioides]